MQLHDVVFSQVDFAEAGKDRFHDGGISGNLFFVTRSELLDLQPDKQVLDLPVAELRTFDPGGGVDAFYGCDVPKGRQAIWGHSANT